MSSSLHLALVFSVLGLFAFAALGLYISPTNWIVNLDSALNLSLPNPYLNLNLSLIYASPVAAFGTVVSLLSLRETGQDAGK